MLPRVSRNTADEVHSCPKSVNLSTDCYTNCMTIRPLLIGIGGAHSDSGKTTLACALLEGALPGWGALKCSPDALYTSVVYDPEELARAGSDTASYLEAGAGGAVLVKAPLQEMPEALELALERLGGLPGVVVEGNSAIEVLRPDIVIFIFNEPERLKESSEPVLKLADAIVYDSEPPGLVAELEDRDVRVFRRDETEALAAFVKDALRERENAGN